MKKSLTEFLHSSGWQIDKNSQCSSLFEELTILTKKKWESNKDDYQLAEFRTAMKVDDFLFEWVQLEVLARLGMWKKLLESFIKPVSENSPQVNTLVYPFKLSKSSISIRYRPYNKSNFQNWFTKKNTLKSVIKAESILACLHKHQAPKRILQDFLICFDDVDRALILARKMKVYRFVVDQYVTQRDKSALMEYKSSIPPQTEDYYYADNATKAL